VILNYTESSAYAAAIAQYFMLMSMGMIIFIWAWRNLVTYFKWFFDEHDDQLEALGEIKDSIDDLRASVEHEQSVELDISA
jgi:hypothetical protein